jgi:hypothetical protein
MEQLLLQNNPTGLYKLLDGQEFNGILEVQEFVKKSKIPVISFKGWGSGIKEQNISTFNENYLAEIEKILPGRQFWIQWDGDNINNETYTRFIVEIIDRFPSNIYGVVSIKQKKEKDLVNLDFDAYLEKTGLNKLKTNIIVGIVPLEEHPENKESGYGIWGALLNKLFAPEMIYYFGGGDVINKEYDNDNFIKSTPTTFFNITRTVKNEIQYSTFKK